MGWRWGTPWLGTDTQTENITFPILRMRAIMIQAFRLDATVTVTVNKYHQFHNFQITRPISKYHVNLLWHELYIYVFTRNITHCVRYLHRFCLTLYQWNNKQNKNHLFYSSNDLLIKRYKLTPATDPQNPIFNGCITYPKTLRLNTQGTRAHSDPISFITARIRRKVKVLFSVCLLVHTSPREGYPIWPTGGEGGEYPHPS